MTIADFLFSPGSITINVGDTVTWSNNGPSAHTATSTNGSFDTGTLGKGQSGSHTFSQAGTFAYYCTIHPNMKGTVIVQASSGGSGSGSGGGSSSTGSGSGGGSTTSSSSSGTSTPTTTSSSGGLPNTGLDSLPGLITGLALLAAGFGLRRRTVR